jgi:hypothetical protein
MTYWFPPKASPIEIATTGYARQSPRLGEPDRISILHDVIQRAAQCPQAKRLPADEGMQDDLMTCGASAAERSISSN